MRSSRGGAARVARDSRPEASDTDQRFPRSFRLTARRQFVEVYNRGRKARRSGFTVFALANDVGHCRLGLTVTRRVGTAVVRNRIKRILRDAFRRHGKEFPGSMDLVINAHASLLQMPPDRVRRELLDALHALARALDR